MPNAEPVGQSVAAGATLGAVAGLLTGFCDVASTVLWLPAGADQLRLAFTLSAIGLGTGAAVGALVGLLDGLLARSVERPWVRHALILAPAMFVVGGLLFRGGFMRRLPLQWALKPALGAALLAVSTAALTLLRAQVVARMEGRKVHRLLAGVALVAAALALHGADHRVLPRLYEYLHAGLGALNALAFAAALCCLAPALARPPRAWAAALFALSIALGGSAFRLVEGWPNVRAELFGAHAPFARHTALAVAAVLPPKRSALADPAAIRRARQAMGGARATVRGVPVRPLAHLILVTVDALRADRIGRVVQGASITPNLDAMAGDAVIFERAITQAPHSSYSISSLHTGEYLHETIPLGQRQPLPTLAATLRARGYNTAALYTNGIFFTEGDRLLAYREEEYGFARASHVDHTAREQTDAAIVELNDAALRGGPTFLWVHYFDAHAPYFGRGDTPEARYDDAVRTIDRHLARLLAHARATLRGDVVFALTADHGEEFGEHGGVYHGSTLYEEQLRVPLWISVPGHRGRRVPTAVCAQLVDLAPTLTALLGVTPPPSMRGNDLRRWMIDGADVAAAPPAFAAVNSRRAVVRWPWKLVVDTTYGVEELIHLASDPLERHNRAADASASAPRGELRAMIAAWLEGMSAQSRDGSVIARGRLGDRAMIPELITLAENTREPVARRVEALDLLSRFRSIGPGHFLVPLMRDREPRVRATAAIVSGNAGDRRSIPTLRDVVRWDDPSLRARAGIALGNLHNPDALDALVDASASRSEDIALGAVLALGELRDPRGVDPLLRALADTHLRYRAVFSLGQIGDVRAYDRIVDVAEHDPTDDARANAVLALGMLRDRRALPLLTRRVLANDRVDYAAGAISALGVVGGEVPGFEPQRFERAAPQGFVRCGRYLPGWPLRELRTSACASVAGARSVSMPVNLPRGPAVLVLRARVTEGSREAVVRAGTQELGRVTLTHRWESHRLSVDCEAARALTLTLDAPATVEVAHAMFVRR